jgi:hypothetical protein
MKPKSFLSRSCLLAALLGLSFSSLSTGCGTGSGQLSGSYGYSMGYIDDPWGWDDPFYRGPVIIGPPVRPQLPHFHTRPMPRPPRR